MNRNLLSTRDSILIYYTLISRLTILLKVYPLSVFNLFRLNECHYNEIQFKFAVSCIAEIESLLPQNRVSPTAAAETSNISLKNRGSKITWLSSRARSFSFDRSK